MEKKATKETPLTKLDQDNFSHTKELLDMLEISSFTFTTAIKDSMKVLLLLIFLGGEGVSKRINCDICYRGLTEECTMLVL